jgi:dTDP-4-dehydrorhamnose 3,5-epimerase
MNLEPVPGIPEAVLGELTAYEDPRGFFVEIFRQDFLGARFVQANHSHSKAGVLRGLHHHRRQADAWYVISGEAQAVLADLRTPTNSPAVASIDLSASRPRVIYIPPGVAHGFLALTDVDLIYWVTHYFDASDEFGVAWDDPTLNVPWRIDDPILSDRDRNNPRLEWGSINVS